ncbi:MAG: glucosamine-6-phosphate deaminase [Ruminococcaceae bacterium]|nr:glucosamine-6-phosphate deaminase [Oscillospiraceae bacterium]
MAIMKEMQKDLLKIKKYDTRAAMGAAAAADAERTIVSLLAQKDEINMIFAAAPSQNEVLQNLLSSDKIDWTRINAFHMDEYVGLPEGDPHSFGVYLKEHIFAHKPFKSVHYIHGWAEDADAECARYAALLQKYPTDVICLGIGENGHIAFNDPWVAEFDDKKAVKVVELDAVCRQQQVNDGCFPTLDDVPTHALTLTLPTLFAAKHLFCAVPAATKAAAVKNTVFGEIGEDCPATIMRRHASATLYCDADSGKDL